MKTLKIQFRWHYNEVIAVFPYEIETDTTVTCYSHVGQHSTCAWYVNQFTQPVKKIDYNDLLHELQSIYKGYKLIVIKKRSHKEYLTAYYASISKNKKES